MYFQFPLMVLIIAPAIDGLRKDWREASENMGASAFQYWRYVALPILLPSLLGTVILLFGNAFGAQATAYELSGGAINIVTILITRQIRGDVLPRTRASATRWRWAWSLIMAITIGGLRVPPAARGAVAAMSGGPVRSAPPRRDRLTADGRDRRAPPSRGAVRQARLVDRLPASASCTSSCRCSARSCSRCARSRSSRPMPSSSTTRSSPRPSSTRSSIGLITIIVSIDPDRPDRVLGPAPPAAPAAVHRVHHPAAVRHPADHPGLRPHPLVQRRSVPARRLGLRAATSCSSRPTSSCRSRTCTGPSTPACGRSTCAA